MLAHAIYKSIIPTALPAARLKFLGNSTFSKYPGILLPRLYLRAMSSSEKNKVLLTRKINPEATKYLKDKFDLDTWDSNVAIPRDELLMRVKGKHGLFVLLTDKIDKEVLDVAKDLKVVCTMSVGFDHLDLGELKKRNIRVGYTPSVLTEATAELTVALLLATSRRLFEASHEARTGGWSTWDPFWMTGSGLAGSNVGIVGFGAIGAAVANRLAPFKPNKIMYVNRSDRTKEAASSGARKAEFEEVLKESDFIIVTIALNSETKKMFNRASFDMMKPNCIFVNTSRGDIVDQEALLCALEERKIKAAGLDVTVPEPLPLNHPFFKMPQVVILPHIGSAELITRNAMAMLTCRNLYQGLENAEMPAELKL